jgi:23S rRNA pseudouridine1911/1915/1917 synthase
VRIIIERGSCTLEGSGPIRPSTRLSPGDVLVIAREIRNPGPLPDHYDVLYEDEHLYVVDKPAGLPVHPTASYMKGTLVDQARQNLPDTPPTLCHRLDRETSGIVVLAKDRPSQTAVMLQFEKRTVGKSYIALVHGQPDPPAGRIDVPMRLSQVSRIKMKMETVAESDHGEGLPSVTGYETLETSPRFALVRCRPRTGRQHQIRVHMTHVGHPLVGDKIYGVPEQLFIDFIDTGLTDEMLGILLLERHALHAASIRFRHPATGEVLDLESPLPGDIRSLFDQDRGHQDRGQAPTT